MDLKFYRNVILKAFFLFIVLNLILVSIPPSTGGKQFSIYNSLVPGRLRFPFGETPREAYNFSLYDVDAMFAAHEINGGLSDRALNVFLVGDSSVWGTLLTPQETLAGQLNNFNLTCGETPLHFYNLGYPTISLTKDLMLMEETKAYNPDLVLWLTTLEAMPLEKQLASPLAENNPSRIETLNETYRLGLMVPPKADWWQRTLFGRRRAIADWVRLQVYGIMWGATGVDQIYPDYTPAAWDLEADDSYYDFEPDTLTSDTLFLQAFPAAQDLWSDTPLLVVNEPIMISGGENSDIRYNFFYPRWAYDQYRQILSETMGSLNQNYVDAWWWVPAEEFTNSAIHLTPEGERLLAIGLEPFILDAVCP
ncbi:MAG: hypothetical protein CL609_21830 [Anaerolineaceae bacterium]|nr:hypothetical protein [Anaerolineaceae bacterium]